MLKRTQVYGAASTTLMGFFDAWHAGTTPFASPLEPFTVTVDTISYSCVFSAPPQITYRDYDNYDCVVQLAEV
jgi:hypothetical protein